eukprot:gene818-1296_t
MSADWMNQLLGVAWPAARSYASAWIAKKNRIGSYNLNVPGVDLIHRMDLGRFPLMHIDGIQTIAEGSEEGWVTMDVAVHLAGDANFGTRIRLACCPLSDVRIELQQLTATLKLRVHLGPIIPTVPYFAAMAVSMLEPPEMDFKLYCRPSRFLPGVDLASVPGFQVMTRRLMHNLLGPTLVCPSAVYVPILDMEDSAVYYHLDLTQKVDGMLVVKVTGYDGAECASWDLGARFRRTPDAYVTVAMRTRLDAFDALRRRPYEDRFQHTHAEPLRAAEEAAWGEEFQFLVDEPEDTLLTLGVFAEASRQNPPRVPKGQHRTEIARLDAQAAAFVREIRGERGPLYMPLSYEVWSNLICPSEQLDPADPTAQPPNPEDLIWPGFKNKSVPVNVSETNSGVIPIQEDVVVEERAGAMGRMLSCLKSVKALRSAVTGRGAESGAQLPQGLDDAFSEMGSVAGSVAGEEEQEPEASGGGASTREQTDLEQMLATEVAQRRNTLLGVALVRVSAPKSGEKTQVRTEVKGGILKGGHLNLELQWNPFMPFGSERPTTAKAAKRGMIFVHVLKVKGLLDPVNNPLVRVTVESLVRNSACKRRAHEEATAFDEMFVFPIVLSGKQPILQVQLRGDKGASAVGVCSVRINDIVKHGRISGDFTLQQVQSGIINMELTWREKV